MSKFKVGDDVVRVHRLGTDFKAGRRLKVTGISANGWLQLRGMSSSYDSKHFSTPPHKHAALIHAWADGAVIECIVMKGTSTVWIRCDIPNWTGDVECYRIKPEKSAAELEKEAIIKEMEALKVRLSKLEV